MVKVSWSTYEFFKEKYEKSQHRHPTGAGIHQSSTSTNLYWKVLFLLSHDLWNFLKSTFCWSWMDVGLLSNIFQIFIGWYFSCLMICGAFKALFVDHEWKRDCFRKNKILFQANSRANVPRFPRFLCRKIITSFASLPFLNSHTTTCELMWSY